MNSYGCVKCQERHFEDEPRFQEHILFQSKHGITNDVPPMRNEAEITEYKASRLVASGVADAQSSLKLHYNTPYELPVLKRAHEIATTRWVSKTLAKIFESRIRKIEKTIKA